MTAQREVSIFPMTLKSVGIVCTSHIFQWGLLKLNMDYLWSFLKTSETLLYSAVIALKFWDQRELCNCQNLLETLHISHTKKSTFRGIQTTLV